MSYYRSFRHQDASAPPYQDDTNLRKASKNLLDKIESLYSYPNAPKTPSAEQFIADVKTMCAIANSEHAQNVQRSSEGYKAAVEDLELLFNDIARKASSNKIEGEYPHYTRRLNRRLRKFQFSDESVSAARERLGLDVDEAGVSEGSAPRPSQAAGQRPVTRGQGDDSDGDEVVVIESYGPGRVPVAITGRLPAFFPMNIQNLGSGRTTIIQDGPFTLRHGEHVNVRIGSQIPPVAQAQLESLSARFTHRSNTRNHEIIDRSIHASASNAVFVNNGTMNITYGSVIHFD